LLFSCKCLVDLANFNIFSNEGWSACSQKSEFRHFEVFL
jgi:hypothetical protein